MAYFLNFDVFWWVNGCGIGLIVGQGISHLTCSAFVVGRIACVWCLIGSGISFSLLLERNMLCNWTLCIKLYCKSNTTYILHWNLFDFNHLRLCWIKIVTFFWGLQYFFCIVNRRTFLYILLIDFKVYGVFLLQKEIKYFRKFFLFCFL